MGGAALVSKLKVTVKNQVIMESRIALLLDGPPVGTAIDHQQQSIGITCAVCEKRPSPVNADNAERKADASKKCNNQFKIMIERIRAVTLHSLQPSGESTSAPSD